MSNVLEFGQKASAEWLIEHLRGSAQDAGLDEAKARQIVRQVIIDMPIHTDEERLEWARNWILAASTAG